MVFDKQKIVSNILMNSYKSNDDFFIINTFVENIYVHLELETRLLERYIKGNEFRHQNTRYIKSALMNKSDCIAIISSARLADFLKSIKEEFNETSFNKIINIYFNNQI